MELARLSYCFGCKPRIQPPCFKVVVVREVAHVTAQASEPYLIFLNSNSEVRRHTRTTGQLSASLRHGTKAGWWEGRGAPLPPSLLQSERPEALARRRRKVTTQEKPGSFGSGLVFFTRCSVFPVALQPLILTNFYRDQHFPSVSFSMSWSSVMTDTTTDLNFYT